MDKRWIWKPPCADFIIAAPTTRAAGGTSRRNWVLRACPLGLPGILVLLLVFAALIATYARHLRAASVDERMIAIAGIAIIIGIVVRNLTNDLFLRDGALMFWALNGALLGNLARQPRDGSA